MGEVYSKKGYQKPRQVADQKKGDGAVGGEEDLFQGARLRLLHEAEGEATVGGEGEGPEEVAHQDGLEPPPKLRPRTRQEAGPQKEEVEEDA
jgi:hypothetical protein